MTSRPIIFVTGTDTGVGKTVLTGLLLSYLRQRGEAALALKPFCSGGRQDAILLGELQDGELSLDEINPCYYLQPVAPLIAARAEGRRISIEKLLKYVRQMRSRAQWLLVEGAGGLFVPLATGTFVLDFARRLEPMVIVAARNKLGTINHTLLTVNALRNAGITQVKVVLFDERAGDLSSKTNSKTLKELLAPTPLFCLPFLGAHADRAATIRHHVPALASTLSQILK